MAYLSRHLESRLDPSKLLPGARSAVVVALNYYQAAPAHERTVDNPQVEANHNEMGGVVRQPVSPGAANGLSAVAGDDAGRVARYAWGRDYHRVMKKKLHRLADAMRVQFGADVATRACVDTAPIVERELASRAGVGWIGKNTLVLHPELGSYFVLGVLLTTLELEPDEPIADHCGTCTACLEGCPTEAFPAAYEMDASRCISYLTIEHRGEIPEAFHASMGDWVFGCDVCQEVCPFNRRVPVTGEPDFAVRPPGPAPSLDSILRWTPQEYDKQTRGSATRRATLAMWKRNAEIVRGNGLRGGDGLAPGEG